MKRLFLLIVVLSVNLPTQAALFLSGTINQAVPDGNPTGYSSTINISGQTSLIADLNLVINISGGYNGDLYASLTGPSGDYAVLFNRIGKTSSNPFGFSGVGFTSVTLDDQAGNDIHLFGNASPVTGSYQPDGRTTAPLNVLALPQ